MNEQKECNRCGTLIEDSHFWMGKYWCADCFERQTGMSGDPDMLPRCCLCGEAMLTTTQHVLHGEPVCLHCLLHVGPERAQLLVKIKKLDPGEVTSAVMFLRKMLNRNQTLRLRDAIERGGPNWWVKLPEFGEYVCNFLSDKGIQWDTEVLDEVWDRLVEEAVEE